MSQPPDSMLIVRLLPVAEDVDVVGMVRLSQAEIRALLDEMDVVGTLTLEGEKVQGAIMEDYRLELRRYTDLLDWLESFESAAELLNDRAPYLVTDEEFPILAPVQKIGGRREVSYQTVVWSCGFRGAMIQHLEFELTRQHLTRLLEGRTPILRVEIDEAYLEQRRLEEARDVEVTVRSDGQIERVQPADGGEQPSGFTMGCAARVPARSEPRYKVGDQVRAVTETYADDEDGKPLYARQGDIGKVISVDWHGTNLPGRWSFGVLYPSGCWVFYDDTDIDNGDIAPVVPSKRTFYKTTYTVEILHEEPMSDNTDLVAALEEAQTGDYAGSVKSAETIEVDAKTMVALLTEQRRSFSGDTDPAFFRLDAHGNEIDEDHV